MSFKKLVRLIYFWLGIASGLTIVLAGIAGYIIAFVQETKNFNAPYKNVQKENVAYLTPTDIRVISDQEMPSKKTLGIEYPGPTKAAIAHYYDETHYEIVYIDPYSGRVLKHKNMAKDLFREILYRHLYVWLPRGFGWYLLVFAILLFITMLIPLTISKS